MTFSFNKIGNLGHLGNQMFQYAAIKGLSRKHNRDFMIAPSNFFGSNYPILRSKIDDCFNIKCNRNLSSFPIYSESSFEFDNNFFENPPDHGIDLLGYFQSEKYFKHIDNEIREDFLFLPEIYDPTKEVFDSISDNNLMISLHIRRTDYMTSSDHQVQSTDYYQQALENLDKNLPVLIFSDDIEWCKKQKIFSSDRFLISESDNCYTDLCLMSLCNYHIIANSSFSWWGAWLAKSKKVIAPKKWFSGECVNKSVEDISFSNWIWL